MDNPLYGYILSSADSYFYLLPKEVKYLLLRCFPVIVIDPDSSGSIQEYIDWSPSCLPPCDGCFEKGGYALRTRYMNAWLDLYKKHEDLINARLYRMKYPLYDRWAKAESARQFELGPIHQKYCKLGPLENCSCRCAKILRELFGPYIVDSTKRYSADQIVGRANNILDFNRIKKK
jgi:hypothetical protein